MGIMLLFILFVSIIVVIGTGIDVGWSRRSFRVLKWI